MAATVDRSSPLPLWAQIHADLRRRLSGGEFERHFPTDDELVRDYEVSRHTVREAVRQLSAEGLLVRQQGRGTSLSDPVLEQPLHSLYSLSSLMHDQGIDERNEVMTVEQRSAPPEIATQLGVRPDRNVIFIERLRLANREPIAWDRSWMPADRAAGLLDADLSTGGLYDALAAYCGLRITGGWERIRPVLPDTVERTLLALPSGMAAFSIERLGLAGETPVEWRNSLIRGDRYCLLAQWPSDTQTQPQPKGSVRWPKPPVPHVG